MRQVMTGRRNFRHPLLLLTTGNLLARVSGQIHSAEGTVLAGRLASALFAALAVTLAAALAWEMFESPWPALAVAGIAGFSPELYEFAHYMKEDAALLFGLMAVCYTMRRALAAATPVTMAWLGAATAAAVSAKYLGLVTLALALPAVHWGSAGTLSRRERWQRFGLFFAATLALVNYSALAHPAPLLAALARETGVATHGHRGLGHPVPHLFYLDLLRQQTSLRFAAWLAAAYTAVLALQWRSRRVGEWMLPAFVLGYTALLSFSPITSRRYFLPVSVSLGVLAGMGAWRLGGLLTAWRPLRPAGPWLALAACVAAGLTGSALSLPAIGALYRSFGHDDHLILEAWVRQKLPAAAVLAQDDRVNLPHPGRWEYAGLAPLPQEVRASEFVADLGTVEQMRAAGIQYVAVCSQTYDRFFDPAIRPAPEAAGWYAAHAAFYARLQREGELLWSSPKGPVIYLQPGLALYRLKPAAPLGKGLSRERLLLHARGSRAAARSASGR